MSLRYWRLVFDIEETPSISGPIFKICMSLPPYIGPDIEGFYSISKKRPLLSTFLPLFATRYRRFVFDIGSDIEFLSGNIVHISMSGTIIESILFDIEWFINQYLPYIDVVYDLWCRHRVRCCAYLLNVHAKFQNLKLKLVGRLWTHHRVTRSWPDESTWVTISYWYVSWLDAIAKNIQFKLIVTGPSVGQADLNIVFKTWNPSKSKSMFVVSL